MAAPSLCTHEYSPIKNDNVVVFEKAQHEKKAPVIYGQVLLDYIISVRLK